ncbi:hypothetical protein [Actinacidiphila guanduensis]|uniref:Uncharacterized protein n=1 Tax=Actinacidiphila guanduensis TaxID=310781 RepID=A0A1H0A452_9ACTN|nr:hypothetical protein [Actinacidiphila guanduensis]SDN28612.1 hypothetical protein SAMN05216259_103415 [Actinacidiphila guanduensis]
MPQTPPETPKEPQSASAGRPESPGTAGAGGAEEPAAPAGGTGVADGPTAPDTRDTPDAGPGDADRVVLPEPGPGEPRGLVPDTIRQIAGRATLPFHATRPELSFATAFWYNDLIETGGDHEVIRQYLVTAAHRTRYETGQWTLRPELADPEQPVDELVMGGFMKRWTAFPTLGVAVMPTVDMHLHAERKSWRWATQEITEGLAARAEDIAAIVAEPLPAYILGHTAEGGGRRPARHQHLLEGAVSRPDPEGRMQWSGPELPDGFDGAPVFAALELPDEQLKLLCLGAIVPGGPPTVATFDLLRPAVHALAPPRTRHWWQRRR